MTPRNDIPRDRSATDRAETLLRELRLVTPPESGDTLCAQIVDLTLPMADAAARGYWHRGIDPEDLTQVARLGLMKAIRGYDPGWGCRFPAYAVPTITGELKRHFRDHGWAVRPPRSLQEMRARLRAAEDALRARLRREPTSRELADALAVPPERITETRIAARGFTVASLSADVHGRVPVEPIEPSDPIGDITDWDSVRDALRTLTPRQRWILRMRFVDDLKQAQIAERVGVSQMQISRVLSRCFTQLRPLVDGADEARPLPRARAS